MKATEIVLGRRYVGRNGAVREIVAEGRQYKLYNSQTDTDCVRWRLVTHGSRKTAPIGEEGNSTRKSFAQWAKSATPVAGLEVSRVSADGLAGKASKKP